MKALRFTVILVCAHLFCGLPTTVFATTEAEEFLENNKDIFEDHWDIILGDEITKTGNELVEGIYFFIQELPRLQEEVQRHLKTTGLTINIKQSLQQLENDLYTFREKLITDINRLASKNEGFLTALQRKFEDDEEKQQRYSLKTEDQQSVEDQMRYSFMLEHIYKNNPSKEFLELQASLEEGIERPRREAQAEVDSLAKEINHRHLPMMKEDLDRVLKRPDELPELLYGLLIHPATVMLKEKEGADISKLLSAHHKILEKLMDFSKKNPNFFKQHMSDPAGFLRNFEGSKPELKGTAYWQQTQQFVQENLIAGKPFDNKASGTTITGWTTGQKIIGVAAATAVTAAVAASSYWAWKKWKRKKELAAQKAQAALTRVKEQAAY